VKIKSLRVFSEYENWLSNEDKNLGEVPRILENDSATGIEPRSGSIKNTIKKRDMLKHIPPD
jgi:hypothetical protein